MCILMYCCLSFLCLSVYVYVFVYISTYVTVSFVHKKHKEVVHLLKSGGGEGIEWGEGD